MSKNQALSLRTQWLGDRLRAARERAGYTLKDVGAYIGLDFTLIGKFERGTNPIRPAYIRDLISFYGISNQRERDALLRLNEDAWRKDWWEGDTEDLETGFLDYTWLESRASHIYEYDPLMIPGLLQTPDYATAVIHAAWRENTRQQDEERLVELRMTRQRILAGPNPTKLSAIIGETSLRRTAGTIDTRRDQLRRLIELPDHIELRVLPDAIDWNPGWHGPFTYFEMPDPYPEVAYTEGLVARSFFEEPNKVATFRSTYDDLHGLALSPEESQARIKAVMKEIA